MKTILVVDDFSSVRIYHKNLIRNLGYETVEATNAQEAWQVIEKQRIDLVLLDLLMPNGDGRSLLQMIGAKKANMPHVVVITSESERYGASDLSSLDVFEILNKPVLPKDLARVVGNAIGGPN